MRGEESSEYVMDPKNPGKVLRGDLPRFKETPRVRQLNHGAVNLDEAHVNTLPDGTKLVTYAQDVRGMQLPKERCEALISDSKREATTLQPRPAKYKKKK